MKIWATTRQCKKTAMKCSPKNNPNGIPNYVFTINEKVLSVNNYPLISKGKNKDCSIVSIV